MPQPDSSISDRLRAVLDPKKRGRLRVAEVVAAQLTAGLSWVGANGWAFVLDAPPDVHLSEKDSQRAAARFDLTVRDGARAVFRDRILAWDGTPVMVPDGTKRTELVDGLPVEVDNFREDVVQGARLDIEHTVRVVTKDGSAPHIKARPGTVSTFYSGTTDGYITSFNTDYPTARAGSGPAANTAGTGFTDGQRLAGADYSVWEAFVQWDTSALGTDTVSAATLSLWGVTDASTTDFTSNIRLYDWGASLTAADYVAGANLASNTLLATFASAGLSTGAYNDFTDVALPANVNKAGATRVLVCSSRTEAGNTPTGDEYITWSSANTAGTTQDPKLVVTHAASVVVTGDIRRAFVPQQTGPRAFIPQQPGDLTAQNFSYREPLPGAHTVFHPTPQMLGPRAFRPQSQYDPRVEVAPVAYQPPLPGAETPYHPTPHMLGPRGFRPQRYDPYTPDGTTILNTVVLPAGDEGPVSIPLWTKGLYKPLNYKPLRYSPLRFKPPRYRKPF